MNTTGKIKLLIELDEKASSKVNKLKANINDITGAKGFATQSKNANELSGAVKKATTETEKFNRANKKADSQVKKNNKSTGEAVKNTGKLSEVLKNSATSAALIDGPLGGVASRFTALRTILGSINPAFALFAVGAAATVKILKDSLTAGAAYERQMLRLEAVIKATGGAAGLSASEIDGLAKEIGDSTLASAAGVRSAAALIATFKSIRGDEFERTLKVSADLAEVLGGDLSSAALQVAKALEEPDVGLTALRRSGVSFTQSQKDVIKALVDTGQKAQAQRIILEALEGQLGGAGAAAGGGLAGAADLLAENYTEFLERLGETGIVSLATRALNSLAGVVDSLNDFLDDGESKASNFIKSLNAEITVLESKLKSLGDTDPELKLADAIENEIDALQRQSNALSDQEEDLAGYFDAVEKAAEAQERLTNLKGVNEFDFKKISDAITKNITEKLDEARGRVEGLFSDIDSVELGGLQQQLVDRKITEEEFQEEIVRIRARGSDVSNATEIRKEAEKNLIKVEEEKKYLLLKQKLESEARQKELDAEKALIEFQAQQRLAILNDQRSLDLVDNESYYEQRRQLVNQSFNAENEILRRAISEQERILSERRATLSSNDSLNPDQLNKLLETDRELVGSRNQIQTLNSQLILQENQRAEALRKVNVERQKEDQSIEAVKQQVLTANLELEGSLGNLGAAQDAAVIKVENGFKAMRESLEREFPEGDQSINILDRIVNTRSLEAKFNVAADSIRQKLSELNNITAQVAELADLGSAENSPEVQALNEQYTNVKLSLDGVKQNLQSIAIESQNPAFVAQLEEINRQVAQADRALKQATESTGFWGQSIEAVGKTIDQSLASGLTDAILGFVDGTLTAKEAFKKFAADFLRQIARMIIQQAILNALSGTGAGVAARAKDGGQIQAFAGGGPVRGPGTTRSDSIPALLSNKEYVINARSVKKYGSWLFEALNRGILKPDMFEGLNLKGLNIRTPKAKKFADGGFVRNTGAVGPQIQETSVNIDLIQVQNAEEAQEQALSTRRGRRAMIQFIKEERSEIQSLLGS